MINSYSHKVTGRKLAVKMDKQKSKSTTHLQSVHMGKKYPCEKCEYKATRKSNLTTHHQSVHMGKKYQCLECDYKATKKSSVTTYQQSVHMGKKYPCAECDYQATRRAVSPHISSQSTWVRIIHVMNVITNLHIRAVSTHNSSQSSWVRNRNVITRPKGRTISPHISPHG